MLMARRVVRTKTEQALHCPIHSMVREPYDCIIGDRPVGESGYSPWLPPATRLHGNGRGDDEQTQEQRKTGRAVPAEPERGGHRRATSHFVAVPADRAEQPVSLPPSQRTCTVWRSGQCGVETVVMESTGVYWIPLFGVLDGGLCWWTPGASRTCRVARPTCGTASGCSSCTPTGCCRAPSEYDASYLRQRTIGGIRVAYAVTQMNVKLQHVISNITGQTGMDMHRGRRAGSA